MRAHAGGLPVQIFRPSIVVGERTTGWTASFNVLYTPLKAFVRGKLPAMPARRSAPVDVVPVDYVADAVFELPRSPVDRFRTYNLVAGPQATTVGRLIELSADRFGRREPTVIPPGPLQDARLPGAPRARQRRPRARAQQGLLPLLLDGRRVRQRARPATSSSRRGSRAPPIEAYFDRLLDFAQAAEWGRRPVTRAQAADRLVAA